MGKRNACDSLCSEDGFCRREFRASNFGLHHEEPRIFGEPHCGGSSIIYIIYRIVVTGYFLAILIYSGVIYKHGGKYYAYLTYWAFTVLNIRWLIQMAAAIYHYVKARQAGGEAVYDSMPILMKITWVFYNVGGAISFAISLQYWTMVYAGWALNVVNVTTHAVNAAVVALDSLVSGVPVRLLHVYQSMLMALMYGIFNVIYWAAGGTGEEGLPWVYEILNWGEKPGKSVGYLAVLVFAAPILGHLIMWLLYLVRISVSKHCCAKKNSFEEPKEDTEMVPTPTPGYGSKGP